MLCQFASFSMFVLKYVKTAHNGKEQWCLPWVLQTSAKYWDEVLSPSLSYLDKCPADSVDDA